jgi:hypothetical protein
MTGKVLSIGDRRYLVDKISKTELVLIDYSEDDPNDQTAFRTFYVRIEKS